MGEICHGDRFEIASLNSSTLYHCCSDGIQALVPIQKMQPFAPQPYGALTWVTCPNYDAIMTILGHFYSIIMT